MYLARLETTSNQAYIFASRRLRHAVGGSHLVSLSTTSWVGEALGMDADSALDLSDADRRDAAVSGTDRGPVRIVTAVSGLAILTSPDRASLTRVISEVTRRCSRDAPGLRLAGAVVPVDPHAGGGGLADALAASAAELGTVRARQYDTTQVLPYVALCAYSGLPANTTAARPGGSRTGDDVVPVADLVVAQERAYGAAMDRLATVLDVDRGSLPANLTELEPDQDGSGRDATSDRWMCVGHADGNGVGAVFRAVSDSLRGAADLDAAIALFRRASLGLESAVIASIRDAVSTVHGRDTAIPVLPLIVGGDDVTWAAWHSRSLEFTRRLLEAYRAATATWLEGLRSHGARISPDVTDEGLSLAAGLAFTKPHHPIRDSLRLADQLVGSAKSSKRWVDRGTPPSTVDIHVLMDSSPIELATLRARRRGGRRSDDVIELAGGPYLVDPAAGPDRALHLDALMSLMERIGGPGFTSGAEGMGEPGDGSRPSRSQVQRARQALFEGRAAADHAARLGAVPADLVATRQLRRGLVSPLIDAIEIVGMKESR